MNFAMRCKSRFSAAGQQRQAPQLLAPDYGWFAESFDTVVLKKPKEWLSAQQRLGEPYSTTRVLLITVFGMGHHLRWSSVRLS
jgi:hypothetical protein